MFWWTLLARFMMLGIIEGDGAGSGAPAGGDSSGAGTPAGGDGSGAPAGGDSSGAGTPAGGGTSSTGAPAGGDESGTPAGTDEVKAPKYGQEQDALFQELLAERRERETINTIKQIIPDFDRDATVAMLEKIHAEDPAKAQMYNTPQGLMLLFETQVRSKDVQPDPHLSSRNDAGRSLDDLHAAVASGDEEAANELYRRSISTK